MDIERPIGNKIEAISYSEELEKILGVSGTIDKLQLKLDVFLAEEGRGVVPSSNEDSEMRTLRLIKLFLHKNKIIVQSITKDGPLSTSSGSYCLTLAIMACLLAKRKGYEVKIGRPEKLSRFLHSLIITKKGEIFKIAGKRIDPNAKPMDVSNVVTTFRLTKPLYDFGGSIKKFIKP